MNPLNQMKAGLANNSHRYAPKHVTLGGGGGLGVTELIRDEMVLNRFMMNLE